MNLFRSSTCLTLALLPVITIRTLSPKREEAALNGASRPREEEFQSGQRLLKKAFLGVGSRTL